SGPTALIGAFGKDLNEGAAYVFHRTTTATWTQDAELTPSDGNPDEGFGFSLALSGSTALIGDSGHNDSTGAAYVFVHSTDGWSQQAELTASDGAPGDGFSGNQGVALSGSTAVVGAP